MSIPNQGQPEEVKVVDGSEIEELGKELGAVHRLLCAIRSVGGTAKDVRNISLRPEDLAMLIYRSRGLLPIETLGEVQQATDKIIMNLDADPNIRPVYGEKKEIIIDNRLGIWVMSWSTEGERLVVGDKVMMITHPTGDCIERDRFVNFRYPDNDRIHLNAQAATCLQETGMAQEDVFNAAYKTHGRVPKKVFFLGTVWREKASIGRRFDICARCLISNRFRETSISNEPLPTGEWPEDYFIATLV